MSLVLRGGVHKLVMSPQLYPTINYQFDVGNPPTKVIFLEKPWVFHIELLVYQGICQYMLISSPGNQEVTQAC